MVDDSSKPTSNSIPASPEEVRLAVAEIKRFYQIGGSSLDAYARGKVYGKIAKEAAKVGLNPELLRKARAIAEPRTGYTETQLADLCGLVEHHGFWRGRPIGPSHVIRFLTVPRPQRAAFQREAIKRRRSRMRLDVELRLRFGKRRKGVGRKPRTPGTAEEACYELVRLCEKWQGVCRSLKEPNGTADQLSSLRKDLPRRLRQEIEAAEIAVGRLHGALLRRVPEELDAAALKRARTVSMDRLAAPR